MINTKRELIWAVITLCLLFIIVSNMDYIDQLNTTVSKCEADSGNNAANKLKQFKEWHNIYPQRGDNELSKGERYGH